MYIKFFFDYFLHRRINIVKMRLYLVESLGGQGIGTPVTPAARYPIPEFYPKFKRSTAREHYAQDEIKITNKSLSSQVIDP